MVIKMEYMCIMLVCYLLTVVVWLLVPVQVIDWKDSSLKIPII